jgi:pimeloyl-ACP methyl ester carboxylesterase
MEIGRREFLASVGSAAAVASVVFSEGCADGKDVSAHQGGPGLDPAAFRDRAAADGEFQVAARYWDARVRLDIGGQAYDMVLARGRVTEFGPTIGTMAADVTISGPVETWRDGRGVISMLMPAASGLDHALEVEGDVVRHVAPYQPAILRLVGLVRESSTPHTGTGARDVDREFDTAVGRYVYLMIRGVQYRVYFEEAGQGIPILLQHTAGSDGRQWHHMLEDAEIQKRFRMIAYDLPFHGKSVPPSGVTWWETEYRLTRDLAMDTIVGISHALELERPVYMGCSIGGYLAPDLALYHPDDFRAVIGVNAALAGGSAPSRNPTATANMGRPISDRATPDAYYHPQVSGTWIGSRMYEITSPVAPEAYRRETGFVYSQGGPGVFAGDLYYYSYDHDLANGLAGKIETSRVDVHFISGEFDPTSAPGPGSMAALAAEIPGSTQAIIKGGSHFAMSDDYARFREVLLPVLDKIAVSQPRTTQ